MIAIDTNILIYSHRQESPSYVAASTSVAALVERRNPWAIPWPCIHEFLRVVTSLRIFTTPTTLHAAQAQIEAWMQSPDLRILGEAPGHWRRLCQLITAGNLSGSKIHDARIAAICLDHGVEELWTADRDFSRMPALRVRNPLIAR